MTSDRNGRTVARATRSQQSARPRPRRAAHCSIERLPLAARLADPRATRLVGGLTADETLIAGSLGTGRARASGTGADHWRRRLGVAQPVRVAVTGAAARAAGVHVAGRVTGPAIVGAGRRSADVRRLAATRSSRHRWIGQAADETVVARALHPAIAGATLARAGRRRAVRLGSADARPTGNFLPILTADQPGIAVALDSAGAIAALGGTGWRRALILGLARPGPAGDGHAVLAADQSGVAGAEHAAVAFAALTGARRRDALRLGLAGTRATGNRLTTLTADQSRVTVALHSTRARASLASARRIAFGLGQAGTGSTGRTGRATADQAGVTG